MCTSVEARSSAPAHSRCQHRRRVHRVAEPLEVQRGSEPCGARPSGSRRRA
jgi:hypothetical protein